ncbi:MAG: hypothetical protein OEQ12_07120 [Nitrosopumilus sp.]|nr:hypothetical protein [Nitrosopumilus sp.]
MDKQKLLIIGLLVALIISIQYLVLDKWMISVNQEINQNSQVAYHQGVFDAVSTIYQQTENCEGAPITIGNLTKTVFDAACLRTSNQNP